MASSPTQVQPSTPNQFRSCSQSQRLANDVCFHCRNQGHWAKDCPFKTPTKNHSQTPNPKSPSSSSSPSKIEPGPDFPPFPCPNGHGTCLIRTSQTPKNPRRSFYTCSFSSSPNSKCGFFKWCDQVKEFESHVNNAKRDRTEDHPDCRCRAGKCKVVRDKGVEYYVCPITKGHGACNFRKRVDDADTSTAVTSNENNGNEAIIGSPKRTKFVSTVAGNPDPASTPVGPSPCPEETIADSVECDDILDLSAIHELALRERELCGFVMEKEFQISCSPSEGVHHRQAEFLRQISADEDETATVKDLGQKFLSTLISGWLGRLVYSPSGGLTVPQAKPFFCCVFPSFDPIHVPKIRNEHYLRDLNNRSPSYYNIQRDTPWQITSQDPQSGVLLELSSIHSVPGIRRGRDFTMQISRSLVEAGLHVQNQLLAILESTELSNHKSMDEAANKTFAVLNLLSVDHVPFSECVRDFIASAKSLAEVEESMKGKLSSEEITKKYDDERANFENISRIHSETANAVMVSDQCLKLLGEEASLLKAKLDRVQSQLRECEADNVELKTRARKVSEEMLKSEAKLQEAEEAKKIHEEREAEHSAAKEALELAQARLRH